MKAFATSAWLSAAVICGARAVAGETAPPPAPVDAQATHKTLMKECLDKQRSQNSSGSPQDARKLCAIRVKTRMQQMKDAGGALPPASTPQSPAEHPP
jgi:hypothetical protein